MTCKNCENYLGGVCPSCSKNKVVASLPPMTNKKPECQKCQDYHYVCGHTGKTPCLEPHTKVGIPHIWTPCPACPSPAQPDECEREAREILLRPRTCKDALPPDCDCGETPSCQFNRLAQDIAQLLHQTAKRERQAGRVEALEWAEKCALEPINIVDDALAEAKQALDSLTHKT